MADYFIDKNRGNDLNTGLSKDTAWKTLEKFRTEASAGTIAAGSSILLESSSIFNESRYLRFGTGISELFNGTENARISINKYDYSSQYSGNPQLNWQITPITTDWVFDASFGLWYIPRVTEYSNANQQWGGHPRVTINGKLCPIVRYESSTFSRGELPSEDYEVFVYETTQPGRLYIYSPVSINPSDYYGSGSIVACPTQFGIFAFFRCGSYITLEGLELKDSGKLVTLYSDSTSLNDLIGFKLINNFGSKIGVLGDFTAIDATKKIQNLEILNNRLINVGGLGLHLSGYFNGVQIRNNYHSQGNLARTDGGAVYIQSGTTSAINGIVVANNYYEKMNANSKGSESDGCAVYCEVRADNVIVSQNVVRDSYMAFQDNSGKNNLWVGNVALNCDSFIKVTDADDIATSGQRTRIINNTALLRGNFWQTFSTRDYGVRLMNGPTVAASTYTYELKNNTFVMNKADNVRTNTTAVADVSGATLEQSNNAVYGWDLIRTRVGVTTELGLAGAITTNPFLTSGGQLYPNSPLIEMGSYLGSLQDNNNTTYWTIPSIGAFEYIRPRTAASTRTMRT